MKIISTNYSVLSTCVTIVNISTKLPNSYLPLETTDLRFQWFVSVKLSTDGRKLAIFLSPPSFQGGPGRGRGLEMTSKRTAINTNSCFSGLGSTATSVTWSDICDLEESLEWPLLCH